MSIKIAACTVLLIAVLSLAYVRTHGFSAREKPAWYEVFLARNARRLASEPGAAALKNPITATPLAIAEARDHFADHCAASHANNGDRMTQINAGLYPHLPQLTPMELDFMREVNSLE